MSGASANRRGMVWMVAAMAAFALEDALFKTLTHHWPIGQALVVFGLGGALVFAALAARQGIRLLHRDTLAPAMRLRAAFELIGRLFYFLAIALTPLSSATIVLQATPALVVLGASLFLGEQIGWRRWTAVGLGLVGVCIVLRPSATDFSVLSLLTVPAILGFAGRDLASRAAPRSLTVTHLGFHGFLTVMVAGLIWTLLSGQALARPDLGTVALLAGAAGVGVFAYAALMTAMRTGDVASVTPFRYTRLFFGIGLGTLWFHEPLSASMAAGCAILVVAGLMIAWHGKAVTRS